MSLHAKVTIELTVSVPDRWNDDCQIQQVRKQASKSALNIIRNKIHTLPDISVNAEPTKIHLIHDILCD